MHDELLVLPERSEDLLRLLEETYPSGVFRPGSASSDDLWHYMGTQDVIQFIRNLKRNLEEPNVPSPEA